MACLYCTVSVVVKMLPAPFIGVGEYHLFVVREVVASAFHHVSRWCTCIFLCELNLSAEVRAGRTK